MKTNRSCVLSCSNIIIFQNLMVIYIHVVTDYLCLLILLFIHITTRDVSKPKQACVRRVRNRFFRFTSLFICWRSLVPQYSFYLSPPSLLSLSLSLSLQPSIYTSRTLYLMCDNQSWCQKYYSVCFIFQHTLFSAVGVILIRLKQPSHVGSQIGT